MENLFSKDDIYSWLEMPKKRSPSKTNYEPSVTVNDSYVVEEPIAYEVDDKLKRGLNRHFEVSSKKEVAENFEVSVLPMLAPQAKAPEFFMDNFKKSQLAKQGISKISFENFKEKAGLDYNQIAQLLCVARNTMINKKGLETFDVGISEKLIALAEIYTHGYDVFGSEPTFHEWLNHPNRALGGVVPFSLLDTQYGRQEVHTILGRIEWGVYS